MATSDATWGDLARKGGSGWLGCGSWIRGAGGLRRLAVGCRGLDGVSAGGLCGSSLHSQGNSGGGLGFRAVREGGGVRFLCSFRHDPLTLGQF